MLINFILALMLPVATFVVGSAVAAAAAAPAAGPTTTAARRYVTV